MAMSVGEILTVSGHAGPSYEPLPKPRKPRYKLVFTVRAPDWPYRHPRVSQGVRPEWHRGATLYFQSGSARLYVLPVRYDASPSELA